MPLILALPLLAECGAGAAVAFKIALAILAGLLVSRAGRMIADNELNEASIAPASSLPRQGEVVTAPDAAAQVAQAAAAAALSIILGTDEALEYTRRYNKPPRKPKEIGVQYCLTAANDDYYIHFNLDKDIPLKKGDTWKYGETMKWVPPTGPQGRYSKNDLEVNLARGKPVEFNPQYQGRQNQIKAEEYKKIIKYKRSHGGLRPPGNRIDR
jgi:hypothetical protein